jgi:hypothetical protein
VTLTCVAPLPSLFRLSLTRRGRDVGSSRLRVLTAFSSNTSQSKRTTLFLPLTSQSHDNSDHDAYPPPRQRARVANGPRILYDGQNVEVAIHRTIEYNVELPSPPTPSLHKHPLSKHSLGNAIVLKDMSSGSCYGSPSLGSTSGSEFGGSGAASPVIWWRGIGG